MIGQTDIHNNSLFNVTICFNWYITIILQLYNYGLQSFNIPA